MNYQSRSCWISPTGVIIPVDVKDHFTKVCLSLNQFDLCRDQRTEAYSSGKAGAEKLMELLLGKGWIRVSDRGGSFLVEFDNWSLGHRGRIRTWMAQEWRPGEKTYLVSRDGKYYRVIAKREQL